MDTSLQSHRRLVSAHIAHNVSGCGLGFRDKIIHHVIAHVLCMHLLYLPLSSSTLTKETDRFHFWFQLTSTSDLSGVMNEVCVRQIVSA